MLDIAVLQQMYGANYGYRANALTGELSVDGIGQGQSGANRLFKTLSDGGGRDTFDLSNYDGGVTLDLTTGGWSTFSVTQLSYLGAGHCARANVFNAMLFNSDLRSLIEDAIGGAGTNTLFGGLGDDTYIIGSAGDVVREDASDGIDWVIATVSHMLAANVEELVFAGSDAIKGTSNALTNLLTENGGGNLLSCGDGADTLSGGGRNDTLCGGLETDVLTGGKGYDIFRFASRQEGQNRITDSPAAPTIWNSQTWASAAGWWRGSIC